MNGTEVAARQLGRLGSWLDQRARAILGADAPRLDAAARRVLRQVVRQPSDSDGRCLLPPEWLVLGVNNFCDLRCKMCDVGLQADSTVFWKNLIGDDPRNMSLELLGDLLAQAKDFWPRPKVGLAFTEPLLHKRVVEFCDLIVSSGFFCQITTNGTMLPRIADDLVDVGVNEITVSVDGPPAVHDRIRGKQGTFEKLHAGVMQLNAAKARRGRAHPTVRFSFTVLEDNFESVVEFVTAVADLRPASINISLQNFITAEMADLHNQAHGDKFDGALRVTSSNLGTANLAAIGSRPLLAQLAELRALAEARARSGGAPVPFIQFVPGTIDSDLLQRYYGRPLEFVGSRKCTDPFRMMMIRTDGSVIPAHGRCFDLVVGRLGEENLGQIWNSDRFRAFRRTLLENGGTLPACSRCCGVIGKTDRAAS